MCTFHSNNRVSNKKCSMTFNFYFKPAHLQNLFWHSLLNSRYNFLLKIMICNVSLVRIYSLLCSQQWKFQWVFIFSRNVFNNNGVKKVYLSHVFAHVQSTIVNICYVWSCSYMLFKNVWIWIEINLFGYGLKLT